MSRPPRLARFLIGLLASRERNEAYFGNIEEMYTERIVAGGIRRSRLWFWREALGSLPTYLRDICGWSFSIFKNYLKTAVRSLLRRKSYALINITGLAVLIACLGLFGMAAYSAELRTKEIGVRKTLGLGVFPAASGLALVIALVTVGYLAWKAAAADPAKCPRYE